jgi:hypothetical protein
MPPWFSCSALGPRCVRQGSSRIPRLRRERMVRPDGASRYPTCDHRQALPRDRAVLAAGEVRKRLDELGMEVIASSPAEFAAVIASETAQWAKVIKDAGIKISE